MKKTSNKTKATTKDCSAKASTKASTKDCSAKTKTSEKDSCGSKCGCSKKSKHSK